MALIDFKWLLKSDKNDKPLLEIEKLSVRLGGRLVFENLDLILYQGDQVQITGPNGAGKTTLLNAILGDVPIESGVIKFEGKDITNLQTNEIANMGIAYMLQRENIFSSLTVEENLHLALGKGGYNIFKNIFPDWAYSIKSFVRANFLSGGQKQKLAMGMSFCKNSKLLLLDEPLAGMNAEDKRMLSNLNGSTVLFIEHN